MIKLSCVILFSMTINCKKHNFGGSAQDGFKSVFSANCFVWLAFPKLKGFVLSTTPPTPLEHFNEHQSRPHFTIGSPTWRLNIRTTYTLVSSKNSIIVQEVEVSATPDNLGHINQTRQLALKTDMKPSWAEPLKLCFLHLKIVENKNTKLKIIITK